ncbi:LOW QUALITY PROTEIN: hypothetical protein QYF61_026459 [Mycteria americana]|uniref:Uncharacterized protein n=1 Tax=Mycteria americana TaxID=33587 RepID=A0AAN7NIX2_MYCAM|nr:LOW QUALITY PROTEIN: hypothetical protein QYF61_026459 [Mycteria americana]
MSSTPGCRQPNNNVMSPPLIPETNIGNDISLTLTVPNSLTKISTSSPPPLHLQTVRSFNDVSSETTMRQRAARQDLSLSRDASQGYSLRLRDSLPQRILVAVSPFQAGDNQKSPGRERVLSLEGMTHETKSAKAHSSFHLQCVKVKFILLGSQDAVCCKITQEKKSIRLSVQKLKKLGEDTARTADPNWPNGYSIPYDITLSIETGESWPEGGNHCLETGWALYCSKDHRIIERFGLEGTFTGHLVQAPCKSRDSFNQIRLLRARSNLTLNVARDGASTASLGNLGQCLTTLIVKNFFLKSSLNLPSLSLKPLLLVLSQQALLKILAGCYKVSPQPSLLQAEQPQLSQPVLVGEVLQPSHHFRGPPLDPLQQLHVLLVLRDPELDTVLQVGSHQSRVEGQDRLPQPAGHAAFDAAQDMAGLLGCERTLSAHVQLFVHQCPQVLFPQGCSRSHHPPACIETKDCPNPWCRTLYLALLNLMRGPFLQLVQVPLDGILSFWHANRTQLGVIYKLAEGALDLTVNVIENIEEHWSQYGPLRDTTCPQSPSGH